MVQAHLRWLLCSLQIRRRCPQAQYIPLWRKTAKQLFYRADNPFFFNLSALVRVAGSDRRCLANPCGFGEEGALRSDCLIFVSKLNPVQEEGGGLKWEPLSQILINVLSKKFMSITFVSHSANEIAHMLAASSNCYCSPGYIQGVVFAESLF
jgi:hypothetical protein